jgi:hypothetical protein
VLVEYRGTRSLYRPERGVPQLSGAGICPVIRSDLDLE